MEKLQKMKKFNFSAGPAALPKEVMLKAQAEFADYQGCGHGILELSHRGAQFDAVIKKTEADIRNFRSKVQLLPKKLLVMVNQMIEDGKREWAIENYIKRNYKGTLGCPTPPTIRTYIEWYEAKKKLAEESGTPITPPSTEVAIIEKAEIVDIDKEHASILDKNIDITNKKDLLERLIKKCIQRLKRVESTQELEGMTASLEAVVGHYIREIHNITTTQLKLSGELQEETNLIIAKAVNESAYRIIQLMFRVIKKIVPDQADTVKKEFFEELQAQKNLQDVLNISESSE